MSGFPSKLCQHVMWICFTGSFFLPAALLGTEPFFEGDDIEELNATAMTQYLDFPLYSRYPRCQRHWRINSCHNKVKIYIVHLHTYGRYWHQTCRYDALTVSGVASSNVYGPETVNVKLSGLLNNRRLTFESSSTSLFLSFTSSPNYTENGIRLAYTSDLGDLPPPVPTKYLYADMSNQTLTFPNHGGNYLSNQIVQWRILSPKLSHVLKYSFISVQMYFSDSARCFYDSLTVYDGFDSTAPILRRFCANWPEGPFWGTSQYLFLRFQSDKKDEDKGFQLLYRASVYTCNMAMNTTITTLTAVDEKAYLTSPNFPDTYPLGCDIKWRIHSTRPNVRVYVEAVHLAYGSSLDFYNNFDGKSHAFWTVYTFTREENRNSVITSDVVFIRFQSSKERGQGFRLAFWADGELLDSSSQDGLVWKIVGGVSGGFIGLVVFGLIIFLRNKTKNQESRRGRVSASVLTRSLATPTNVNVTVESQAGGMNNASLHEPPPSYWDVNREATTNCMGGDVSTVNPSYAPPAYWTVNQDTPATCRILY